MRIAFVYPCPRAVILAGDRMLIPLSRRRRLGKYIWLIRPIAILTQPLHHDQCDNDVSRSESGLLYASKCLAQNTPSNETTCYQPIDPHAPATSSSLLPLLYIHNPAAPAFS